MKLELRDVSLIFQGQKEPVLSHIGFSETFGSLAIIGPSGGGKSTLLRLLAGLLTPTTGEILINEKSIPQDEKSLVEYRKEIGFVFQHGGLFPHMTALENIMIPLIHVHKKSQQEAQERAMALLKQLGLEKDKDKHPSQLSGGQRQRVAIARALATNPKFLLLDEPTSALDPEYTSEVLTVLNDLKQQGVEMIIVTHEMGFARHACEKTAFLNQSTLMEWGDSADIFQNPKTPELSKFLGKMLEWK